MPYRQTWQHASKKKNWENLCWKSILPARKARIRKLVVYTSQPWESRYDWWIGWVQINFHQPAIENTLEMLPLGVPNFESKPYCEGLTCLGFDSWNKGAVRCMNFSLLAVLCCSRSEKIMSNVCQQKSKQNCLSIRSKHLRTMYGEEGIAIRKPALKTATYCWRRVGFPTSARHNDPAPPSTSPLYEFGRFAMDNFNEASPSVWSDSPEIPATEVVLLAQVAWSSRLSSEMHQAIKSLSVSLPTKPDAAPGSINKPYLLSSRPWWCGKINSEFWGMPSNNMAKLSTFSYFASSLVIFMRNWLMIILLVNTERLITEVVEEEFLSIPVCWESLVWSAKPLDFHSCFPFIFPKPLNNLFPEENVWDTRTVCNRRRHSLCSCQQIGTCQSACHETCCRSDCLCLSWTHRAWAGGVPFASACSNHHDAHSSVLDSGLRCADSPADLPASPTLLSQTSSSFHWWSSSKPHNERSSSS